ncbi:hypothetical protein [Pelagicoccus sp. SDUM812003]|uniref:hypothetical protein n=1 Tax=Pelagicoccus sp. SDUM812003 TaxID=3041267 RepID=UPI00280E364A|nr:hypothetical protein [Pelagicoccus sp. SDUM812003]MDQ8204561.1 hypothetical protein [Pelagicoccus sp. SDUM812003]
MIERRFRPVLPVLLFVLLASSGCREEVRVYDAPKEDVDPVGVSGVIPQAPSGNVLWQKAEQWQELPPTPFRKGNYLFQQEDGEPVEITVSSFPGSTGGLLANVNRWLGQAELETVDQAQLIELLNQRELPSGESYVVVDLSGDSDDSQATRIYAAVLMYGGQSWFFKMTGPSQAVESQIPAFDEMMRGLQLDEPEMAAGAAEPDMSESDHVHFTAPKGWVESEGSSLRIASYKIEKEGLPPADFAITSFPGDTGGLTANVNRWRRQIGLEPWSPDQVTGAMTTFTSANGLKFRSFDLKSSAEGQRSEGDQRILVAILEHGGRSWFFKLRGDALLLETQRNKFRALLESVTFEHNHP